MVDYRALGMVMGSLVSVFFKDRIHGAFERIRDKKWGLWGVVSASLLGVAYVRMPAAATPFRCSRNPDHVRANFDIFDFALTADEMAEIAALNRDTRYDHSTPELLAGYAKFAPPVEQQK